MKKSDLAEALVSLARALLVMVKEHLRCSNPSMLSVLRHQLPGNFMGSE